MLRCVNITLDSTEFAGFDGVVKMPKLDLGSSAARRAGSIPVSRPIK